MSTLKIITKNCLDTADTLTATSELSGFPIGNTKTDSKSVTWRSNNQLTTQQIDYTWSSEQVIGGVAIAFSNFDTGSIFKVVAEDLQTGGSVIFDSGDVPVDFIYDVPAGFSTMNSDSFPYGGGSYHSIFFSAVSARKLTLHLTSAGNPDGFIEVSRFIAGKTATPIIGAKLGATFSMTDQTQSIVTDSGDMISNRGTIAKRINFNLGAMNNSDRSLINSISRRQGKSQPVFISLSSGIGGEIEQSHQIYGRFLNDHSSEYFSFNLHRSSIGMAEI